MSKEKKPIMDFRYYAIPERTRMLTVQGDEWIQCFGDGVNEFHFHNHIEIGYCYYGTGDIVFQDRRMPFAWGTITVIPENIPHITKSVSHTISRWEYIYGCCRYRIGYVSETGDAGRTDRSSAEPGYLRREKL